MRILLLLISFNLFSQDTECPGYVFDKELEGGSKFTGECAEGNIPVWGTQNFIVDTSFQGFFNSEGFLGKGIYTYLDGKYFYGEWNTPGEILGSQYSRVGRFVFSDGTYAEAYFDNRFDAIGFGIITASWGYKQGMLSNSALNGIGVTRVDEHGYSLYGTFVNDKPNGTVFVEFDNGEIISNYLINGEPVGDGPSPIQEADRDQLEQIKKFLNLNYAELRERISIVDKAMDDFNKLVNETDAEIEATTKRSKFASKRSLFIKSTQELLAILGYKVGKTDGISGPLTAAAIEAFKQDQGLAEDLSNENLLVELQKQVRKESNAGTDSLAPKDPTLASNGTGFFVSNDIVVTNQHVINNCAYLSDSQNNILEIVAVDRLNDLAVLRSPIKSENYIYLDDDPELGELVYVAGFPLSLETLNFTSGAVSALVGNEKNITQFQFTAPIQPGNSGGPVLNAWGSLIGVTFASINAAGILESRGVIPQNINYGIKLDVIRDILTEYEIDYDEGRAYWFKPSQEDVAQLAKDTTILINCFK